MSKEINRREFLRMAPLLAIGARARLTPEGLEGELEKAETEQLLPWENGKYQTFPRSFVEIPENRLGAEEVNIIKAPVYYDIDIGTLGPDVDTIVGVDFAGDIPTGALEIYRSEDEVRETRVVFIKRADVETVQITGALGGDRFDIYQISEHGGDTALDTIARRHATNTARQHQKVVYLGDLGLFEKEWGEKEESLLNRIIKAQRPAKPKLVIREPDFVNPRNW